MTRLQAGLLVLAIVPVAWLLLWWGWRGRVRRQGDLPVPPAPPTDPGEAVFGPAAAQYVSTVFAGDLLDRVAAHGLGIRGEATVTVTGAGVLVDRHGARPLWVPAAALTGVRRERGMAGKVVDRDGLVVLTWTLGEHTVDTGLRTRHEHDRQPLTDAVTHLIGPRQ